MTDYLELLLAGAEDEDREETAEADRPARPVPLAAERAAGGETRAPAPERRTEKAAAPGDPAGEIGTAAMAEELRRAAEGARKGTAAREWADRQAAQPPAARRDLPEGAVMGGESAPEAALLRRAVRLRRTAAAAALPPPGRGGEAAPAGAAERGRTLTAEGLDRAVQRDARRYDGGFSLY